MGVDNAMQCNAIKKKDMTGQSFIEQAPQTSSKGKMSWCCNTRVHSIYFSLKYFLYKVLLNLFRKDQADAISKLSN
jgi:hypothetical protein